MTPAKIPNRFRATKLGKKLGFDRRKNKSDRRQSPFPVKVVVSPRQKTLEVIVKEKDLGNKGIKFKRRKVVGENGESKISSSKLLSHMKVTKPLMQNKKGFTYGEFEYKSLVETDRRKPTKKRKRQPKTFINF